jgi:hypothetical protein
LPGAQARNSTRPAVREWPSTGARKDRAERVPTPRLAPTVEPDPGNAGGGRNR